MPEPSCAKARTVELRCDGFALYIAGADGHSMVMTNPDALRRADECRQFAKLARDAEMRARWLEMAAEWDRLAEGGPLSFGTPAAIRD